MRRTTRQHDNIKLNREIMIEYTKDKPLSSYNLDIHDLPNEEWRDIKGYEGYYQVSNMGRVKSLTRWRIDRNNIRHKMQGRIMRLNKTNCGYYIIGLCVGDMRKYYLIHRLIAQCFIPNPNNYPCVNHKDEDKTNNCASNLEWCTHLYNNTFGSRMERVQSKRRKRVAQLSEDNQIIRVFKSAREAAKEVKANYSNILEICKNTRRRKRTGGFKWSFV